MSQKTVKDSFSKLISTILVDSAQTKMEIVKLQILLAKKLELDNDEKKELQTSMQKLTAKAEQQLSDVKKLVGDKYDTAK